MNRPQPRPAAPTRRTVVLAGAGTAAALLAPASAGSAAAATGDRTGGARQPYASYWFPDSLPAGDPGDGVTWRSLKAWRPESDPDLAFNTSAVPLAERFTPVPVNTTARTGQARITSLVAFGNTAGNPSQGSATADTYALNHWAYIDELVFWGGSAGEGLILAPNAPVVDAAHRNGVPVLGTVFLPPVHHGGELRWTRDLVQRDGAGRFPLAAKLVAAALAYGFDGWFINAETEGGDAALGAEMLAFVTDLRARGEAAGLRITWYDAMTVRGEVGWQGALNAQNTALFEQADSMFVDFRWTPATLAASGRAAEAVGRSRYDLWAGVDVESTGWNRSVDWDAIIPAEGPHTVSYGFYRPEWTLNHLPDDRTPGQFHAADQRFWTGQSLDPARPDRAGWLAGPRDGGGRPLDRRPPAVRHHVQHRPRSALVRGRPGLLGLRVEPPRPPGPAARPPLGGPYRGPHPVRRLRLHRRLARWQQPAGRRRPGRPRHRRAVRHPAAAHPAHRRRAHPPDRHGIRTGHRRTRRRPARAGPAGGPDRVHLCPGGRTPGGRHRLDHLHPPAELPLRDRPRAGGAPHGGRSGALAARSPGRTGHGADPVRTGRTARHRRVLGSRMGTDLRFGWHRAPAAPRHYELHRVLPDGTRRFLGGTCGTAFFVPGLRREPGEKSARFQVRAVGELYTTSGAASVAHRW